MSWCEWDIYVRSLKHGLILYSKYNSFVSGMYGFKEVTEMKMKFLSVRIIKEWL